MKVKLVSIEDGITALGFRRIAAIIRKINPSSEIHFIPTGSLYSFKSHIFPSLRVRFDDVHIEKIAENLAAADLLCFSSMTPCAQYVEKIAGIVKQKNPNTYILWGGTHCTLYPDDAIKHVDCICLGEGEVPIEIFYNKFIMNLDFKKTDSMWFNSGNEVIKNPQAKLQTSELIDSFPHPFYDISCSIYDYKIKDFRGFTKLDYVAFNGLSYRTVWSIGCPFDCIYCANDAFINLDNGYRKIRNASVDGLIEEIETAILNFPFISSVVFYDDNFIAIPIDVIRLFCQKYKERINLPFVVFGLHPNFITREKMELLAIAGMNRGRMGIQSGSEKMLNFYKRNTSLSKIKRAAKILSDVVHKYNMIPTSYDIITDNPVETREDIVQTLQFLFELDRPYTLTIFSLRVYPKTRLWDYFNSSSEKGIINIGTSYLETKKTIGTIILYILAIFKPPKLIFHYLLKKVRGYHEAQEIFPPIFYFVKLIYLISRASNHLRRLDFTVYAGKWQYYLWKLKITKVTR